MNVFFNGDAISVNEAISLFDLLDMKGLETSKGIAVAVNNVVVSKQEWEKHMLSSEDKVLVIAATKGG